MIEDQQEVFLQRKAIDLFNKNELTKAQKNFEEVIVLNPSNTNAYFYLGNIFHIKGVLGKAIKAFNKVLELDPKHTDASISLSVILNDIGRYEQAKEVFDSANKHVKKEGSSVADPKLNKSFSLKHFELAEMYFSYNRYDEALFEYNKAISLDSDSLEIRIKIAKVYSKKGFMTKAIDELRSLKSEFPNYVPARVALGLLHYGQGNILEAQTEWENALYKDPSNDEVQMYLDLAKNATETNLTI